MFAVTALLVLSLSAPGAAAGAEPAPAAGMFLVASRELTDPNFSKSVVLILRYDESGAMGVIVNRRTRATLEDAMPEIDGAREVGNPIYLGGPVQIGTLRFLARADQPLEDADYVLGDIQVSASRSLLDRLVAEFADDSRLRVFIGYSGWAPGQLENEIARGGWHVVPATAAQVFSAEPEGLWSKLAPPPAPITAMAPPASFREATLLPVTSLGRRAATAAPGIHGATSGRTDR
jgi:putative transcriptional regulator